MFNFLSKMTIVKRVTLGFVAVGVVFLCVMFFFYIHYSSYIETNQGGELLFTIGISAVVVVFVYATSFSITKSINNNLREMIRSIMHVCADVVDSSKSLSDMSSSLAQGNAEQAASIEETSAAMNETTSMIKQNTKNSNQAVDLSKNSEKAASDGVEKIKNLTDFMERLNNSSAEINKIISNINSIASQTTILALNASVEAVRAGESGKTFSVVAEEVRNLAQRSTVASKSTESIINENIQLTKHGLETFRQMEESLEEINGKAGQVTQLLNEIAIASQEQNKGVQQITSAMTEIEKVTHVTTSVAEESATVANKLHSQINNLHSVVGQMQSLLGSFK